MYMGIVYALRGKSLILENVYPRRIVITYALILFYCRNFVERNEIVIFSSNFFPVGSILPGLVHFMICNLSMLMRGKRRN